MKAILHYADDRVQPVTVLRVDANLLHMLCELNERLREEQSLRFTQEYHMAAITAVQGKLDDFFTKALANWSSRLPFQGRYLRATQKIINDNLNYTKEKFQQLFDSGDFDALVDYIVFAARGKFPLLLKPFSGLFLSFLASWLKSNRHVFKAGIVSQRLPTEEGR